jgi:PPOX class probable F420-dependent enzyme
VTTLPPAEARARLAAARVARLATADADGRPHLVPFVFAVEADVVWSAVDGKPKRSHALRRLANVAANPAVSVLADHYDDADWTALWWVRADGRARVAGPGSAEARHAVALLTERYAQYRDTPPDGPVLAIEVERWTGWSAS